MVAVQGKAAVADGGAGRVAAGVKLGMLEPGVALERFLPALAIAAEHIPPQTQDRARLYASVLTACARGGRRVLVVIDNAATHEQAEPLAAGRRGQRGHRDLP